MPIKVNHELDQIYETITLLYNGYDMDRYRKTIIDNINQLGNHGEELYRKYFSSQEKYFEAFNKNRVTSDRDDFYFKDTSQDFYLAFTTPFRAVENFVQTVHQLNNNQIWQIIIKNSDEMLEEDLSEYAVLSHEEFIKTDKLTSFISKFELNEGEKWKMLLILQNPVDYYGYFCDLIIKNFEAFEKAVKAAKPIYDKYLEQFKNTYPTQEKVVEFLSKHNMANCGVAKVYPSLASSSGLIILSDYCYIGLLLEKTMTAIGFVNNGNEYLQSCLKAISDQSKMNILTSLKTNPKYATELATQLGLTPATISHHMNTLLSIQLVYVEKENGKYYFHINKDSVIDILEQLKKALT